MRNARWRKFENKLWLLLLLAATAGSPALAQEPMTYSWLETSAGEESWPRHCRLGVMAGLNLKADFNMNGTSFVVSGSQPGAAISGVDHFYDDSYVRVDQTGNAENVTSFWGYNNASQVSGGAL